jgi:hypothetical protein
MRHVSLVGAVYDRAYFVDSTKNVRSDRTYIGSENAFHG